MGVYSSWGQNFNGMQLNQLVNWSVVEWLSFCHECRCKSQNKANHKGSIDHQNQYILITVHIHNLLSIVLGEPVFQAGRTADFPKAKHVEEDILLHFWGLWWGGESWWRFIHQDSGHEQEPINSEVGQFPGHSILRRRVFTVKNIVNSGVFLANMLQ